VPKQSFSMFFNVSSANAGVVHVFSVSSAKTELLHVFLRPQVPKHKFFVFFKVLSAKTLAGSAYYSTEIGRHPQGVDTLKLAVGFMGVFILFNSAVEFPKGFKCVKCRKKKYISECFFRL
jgi:hypothetical protein